MTTLVLLRSDCDTGRTCPNVNLTGRATYVVQGYTVPAAKAAAAGVHVPHGHIVVEVPLTLLPELASDEHPGFRVIGDAVLAWGPPLTDPEALAELAIPAGEAAIELPYAALPGLEAAHG